MRFRLVGRFRRCRINEYVAFLTSFLLSLIDFLPAVATFVSRRAPRI